MLADRFLNFPSKEIESWMIGLEVTSWIQSVLYLLLGECLIVQMLLGFGVHFHCQNKSVWSHYINALVLLASGNMVKA
jgi:hypothetical protein